MFFFVFRINFQIRNLDSYASCWLDSRHFLSCISFEWSALTRCGCWAYFIIPGNGQINANCGCVRRIKVDKISSRWYSLADKKQKIDKNVYIFYFIFVFRIQCESFGTIFDDEYSIHSDSINSCVVLIGQIRMIANWKVDFCAKRWWCSTNVARKYHDSLCAFVVSVHGVIIEV